jgi:transcriptional regulator with XRE-family HTH domain
MPKWSLLRQMCRSVSHMDTTNHLPPTVAKRVGEAIKSGDYSVMAMAEATHIPRATLTRRLSGVTPFNVSELAAIAAVLGCSPTDFYADAA